MSDGCEGVYGSTVDDYRTALEVRAEFIADRIKASWKRVEARPYYAEDIDARYCALYEAWDFLREWRGTSFAQPVINAIHSIYFSVYMLDGLARDCRWEDGNPHRRVDGDREP